MRLRPAWRRRAYALLAGAVAAVLGASGLLAPLDEAIRAGYVRNAPLARDGATVLVAIDDRSLQRLGPWPWPRRTHAQLIERLDRAGAHAIALDLMMPEAAPDAADDDALARAMRASGRVVLPVGASAPQGALPEELLPVAPLASAARALGHTDLDGAPRGSLFPVAGIGMPRWPALPYALLAIAAPRAYDAAPAAQASRVWERGEPVLLRFAGPAGTYPQYAYVDVLEGRVPADALRGRRVIVGATATGLGHVVTTPMGGPAMSTLEYLANATDTLTRNAQARPVRDATAALLAAAVAFVAVLFGLRLAPGTRLVAATAFGAVLVAGSIVGLTAAGVWWGPVAAIATVLATACVSAVAEWRGRAERADVDGVTGLLSRRRFLRYLRSRSAMAADGGEPLALITLRVEGVAGPPPDGLESAFLLARLARELLAALPGAHDFAGRMGPTELAAVAVGLHAPAVDALLADLRARVDASVAAARTSAGLDGVRVGIGHVVAGEADAHAWPRLLRRAAMRAGSTEPA